MRMLAGKAVTRRIDSANSYIDISGWMRFPAMLNDFFVQNKTQR